VVNGVLSNRISLENNKNISNFAARNYSFSSGAPEPSAAETIKKAKLMELNKAFITETLFFLKSTLAKDITDAIFTMKVCNHGE
jgi:hypothetical protein